MTVNIEIKTWVQRLNAVDPSLRKKAREEAKDAEIAELRAALAAPTFQARVQPWMMACFGSMIASDREERNHRFFEEATELVQSLGMTASEAHQLVDYVYGRPIGEPAQEVGGVMVTLAALCLANDLDMHQAAETELARIWTKVEQIRAKQAAKPKHSPLPQAAPDRQLDQGRAAFERYCEQVGCHDFERSWDSADDYRNPHIQGRWNFWRASREAAGAAGGA